MMQVLGPAKSTAQFRPSAANRWLRCYGSTALTRPFSDSAGSDAAREGTAVHLMGEQALRGERWPEEWLDRVIRVDGYDIVVTEAMVDGAELYVGYVNGLRNSAADAEVEIECRLSLALLNPSDPELAECTGTSDAVAYWPDTSMLEIVDLKFGRGYMVPANSPQLRLYALMAMLYLQAKGKVVNRVRTTVVQPRDPNENVRVRSHDYDVADLWDFAGEVNQAMYLALQPNAPLTPGEEQCQWCPARGVCPALASEALEVARGAFSKATSMHAASPMPEPGPVPTLPDPNMATGEQLAAWLNRREMVEAFFEGVEKRAAHLMTAGLHVPGYKMVKRTGNRKWIDPDNVPRELVKLGVMPTKMYGQPKLLSPKQIEALLPKEAHPALVPFVNRADNGLALVRDTDRKPAATGVFGVAPKRIEKSENP